MNVIPTAIPGLIILEPKVHRDLRGFFMETWREEWTELTGQPAPFVQDNHARSEEKGVLRGLHFQEPPHAQSKLIWVTRGSVYDVAVDVRETSPSFGKWHGLVLSAGNALRFFIPRGFAHGYMTLEPGTEFQYKVDNYYSPAHERGVCWNDPELGIPWPDVSPVLSEKDNNLPLLSSLHSTTTHRNKR